MTKSAWMSVRLGEVCQVVEGQVDPREPAYRDLPHINGEVIETGTGRLLPFHTAAQDGLISGKYLFEPGMILYSKLRPYLRKVTIAPCQGVCSADMYPLTFDPDRVDSGFAMFSLLAEPFTTYAVDASRRARMPKLNRDQLMAWQMRLPESLSDQRRIAATVRESLTVVDAAQSAAKVRLAAAETLPTAYLREVFEGPDGSGWKIVNAADIAQISGGVQKSPGRAPRNHHCPYLTVRNVQRGSLNLSQVERFEVTEAELDRLRLCKGDILVVEGNGSPDQIGRNAVFDLDGDDWIHQNHVIRVRLGGAAIYQFVSLFLNSPAGKAQMLERARSTSGLYTLSVDKIGSLQLPLPPLADQCRIAADLSRRLEAADQLAARCREELAAVEALPASLLRAAFNGAS